MGCGLLSADSVHETLIECGSVARSVHVDLDVVAVDRAADQIAGSGRSHLAAAVRADLRDPSSVLRHRSVRRLVDFDRPVATIAAGVLAHLDDTTAAGLLAAVRATTVDGSFLALTHPTADLHTELNALAMVNAQPRSRAGTQALLAAARAGAGVGTALAAPAPRRAARRRPGGPPATWSPRWLPRQEANGELGGGSPWRRLAAAQHRPAAARPRPSTGHPQEASTTSMLDTACRCLSHRTVWRFKP
ncbi:SAM-dependent methyltransferase [Phytohabitans kaempferiae]|uniref:SAM-dependent methyltransferase n=1 Tax=Phytohabitans kaempferiae TaxID=1620943 RepID=A0ABV6MBI1_9ACTN